MFVGHFVLFWLFVIVFCMLFVGVACPSRMVSVLVESGRFSLLVQDPRSHFVLPVASRWMSRSHVLVVRFGYVFRSVVQVACCTGSHCCAHMRAFAT